MGKYQIAHGFITNSGTIGAGADTGLGSAAHIEEKGKEQTGRYRATFKGKFSTSPAVVISGYPQEDVYPRINQENDATKRPGGFDVDCYDLTYDASLVKDHYKKGDQRPIDFHPRDTDFYVLAVAESSTAVTGLLDDSKVKVVAGVLDGSSGTLAAELSYGGFSIKSNSSKGSYIISFTEAFGAAPTVVATAQQAAVAVLTVHVDDVSKEHLELVLSDMNGDPVDGVVHFIAVGSPKAGSAGGGHVFRYGVVDREAEKDGDKAIVGTQSASVEHRSQYTVTLKEGLAKRPVVVASAEHMKEGHLRQMQVNQTPTAETDGTFKKLKIDVVGWHYRSTTIEKKGKREKVDVLELAHNNSRFHYIAYTPA